MLFRPVTLHAVVGAAIAGTTLFMFGWLICDASWGRALAMGLFSFATSLYVARRAIARNRKQVYELTQTARAMIGDLSVRANMSTGEDTDDLAQALDDLADELASSLGRLKREHDRLGAILEAMVEGVLVTDAHGTILLANSALREMFLVTHDVVGKQPVDAVGNAELQNAFDEVSASAHAVTCEISVGGLQPRRVLARVAPVDHAREGAVALLSDVTELRRLETLRRDFVANVSHELRTPVAAIAAAVETLEIGALERRDAAKEFLSIIDRNTHRLRQLVEDILQLSRIEAKKLNLVRQQINIREVVDHCVDLFTISSDKKHVVLRVEIPEGMLFPPADPRALEQILANLIDNAIKYCPERSVVTVIGQHIDEHTVRLTVRDTGLGIEARHLSRLFERFYRVDIGRSREEGGTGLGLAIVKHLSEAMNGSVSVESQVGSGTSFHLDLPLDSVTPTEHTSGSSNGTE